MTKLCWAGVLVFLVAAGPAWAEGCRASANDAERLACYDRLAECVIHHDADERLACYDGRIDLQAVPAVAVESDEVFPLPGASRREGAEPLVAEVASVQRDPRGLQYLTLDNGQVWRELSNGRVRFAAGDRVELSRGALGSVNLRVEGRTGYVKVRRVE